MARKIRTLLLALVVSLMLTGPSVVVLSVSLTLALAHAQEQGHYSLTAQKRV
jgi:hypothetical protein